MRRIGNDRIVMVRGRLHEVRRVTVRSASEDWVCVESSAEGLF